MSRRLTLVLLLALAAVWFGTLDYRKLVRPDEGRYAEIPREMVATGDWLTPRLNGIKYFEKPALQYWATAAAYEVFGEHEWTSRLWGALTGFAGLFLTGWAAARLFGREAGIYSFALLASAFLYMGIAHINTLDMGLTFFMTGSLTALLLGLRDEVEPVSRRKWMWAFWAFCAFAVLSKGLIGVVLPVAVVVLYALATRDFGLWRRLHPFSGGAVFLAITAPWFVAVSLANPEFFGFFFIHEHFTRFLTKVHGRYHPWYSFIPILLAGFMPWTFTLLATVGGGVRREPGHFQPRWLLLIWTAFIFLFFSASSSKLPSYILPIFPSLAILMGAGIAAAGGRRLFWQLAPVLVLAVAGGLLSPRIVGFAGDEVPAALYEAYFPWALGAALLAILGTAVAMVLAWRERKTFSVLVMAATGLAAGQLAILGHNSLAPASSAWGLAQQIRPWVKPDIPFYSVGMYEQTLPFYIKRTVTLVQHLDELEFGIGQEPDLWVPSVGRFVELWRQPGEALAIMQPGTYEELKAVIPMQIIGRDTRRVVVKKP